MEVFKYDPTRKAIQIKRDIPKQLLAHEENEGGIAKP